jgi:hypothetical protein
MVECMLLLDYATSMTDIYSSVVTPCNPIRDAKKPFEGFE